MREQSKSNVEPAFSVHLIRPFVKALQDHPAVPREMLDALDLDDQDKRTPVSVAEDMLKATIELTGERHLGLKAALAAEPGDYEVLEYTVSSAANVREAIDCLCRYMRLVNDAARFRLEVIGDRAYLDLATSVPMSQISTEYKVAAVCTAARRYIEDPLSYLEIWFTHPEPDDLTMYRKVFGDTPLVFGAPKDALVMEAGRLERPLKNADRLLHHVLRRHADQLLQELPKTDSLSERVRRHILDTMPDGSVSADRVAGLLNMSRRTLTRHLSEESTTFRELLEDTRKRMAKQYLATTNMSASDVAFLLGFSEAAPFVRAFKRWTGKTPTEFRREQRR